jgi:hypothetical protein
MLEIALNIVAIACVSAPVFLLEWLRKRSRWIDKNHDGLSVVVWLGALICLYAFVLPMLHLEPNPRVSSGDPS